MSTGRNGYLLPRMTIDAPIRRPFSPGEKAVIAVQLVLALSFGILGIVEANDPDWGDLQRIVILMLTFVWLGGIVVSVVVARLVTGKLARVGILVVAPFAGFLVILALSAFAAG